VQWRRQGLLQGGSKLEIQVMGQQLLDN